MRTTYRDCDFYPIWERVNSEFDIFLTNYLWDGEENKKGKLYLGDTCIYIYTYGCEFFINFWMNLLLNNHHWLFLFLRNVNILIIILDKKLNQKGERKKENGARRIILYELMKLW